MGGVGLAGNIALLEIIDPDRVKEIEEKKEKDPEV